MTVLFPKDCLAYHQSRALLRTQSLEKVSCAAVAVLMKKFSEANVDVRPETDALRFYQLSHAFALIQQRRHPHEPLPAEELRLVDEYFTLGATMAERCLYYLILICTRETRHLHDKDKWEEPIKEQFGTGAFAYIKSLPDEAHAAMTKFTTSPPKAMMGPYLQALAFVFYKGKWSSGYGGKAWGNVTDCAINFIVGKYSPAMMLDTSWTLCHNNGSIFNKRQLYSHYTNNCLQQILDVQRAGFIPTLIDQKMTPMSNMALFIDADIAERNVRIRKLFPDLPTEIDWEKVQELGAVLHWTNMAKTHKVKAKPAAQQGAMWEIHPGHAVPKIKMKRAA